MIICNAENITSTKWECKPALLVSAINCNSDAMVLFLSINVFAHPARLKRQELHFLPVFHLKKPRCTELLIHKTKNENIAMRLQLSLKPTKQRKKRRRKKLQPFKNKYVFTDNLISCNYDTGLFVWEHLILFNWMWDCAINLKAQQWARAAN